MALESNIAGNCADNPAIVASRENGMFQWETTQNDFPDSCGTILVMQAISHNNKKMKL
jgi:hypothetical protein